MWLLMEGGSREGVGQGNRGRRVERRGWAAVWSRRGRAQVRGGPAAPLATRPGTEPGAGGGRRQVCVWWAGWCLTPDAHDLTPGTRALSLAWQAWPPGS